MEDDRILGRLEEFKDWAKDEFKFLQSEVGVIRTEVEKLEKRQAFIQGKLVAASSVAVLILETVMKKFLN